MFRQQTGRDGESDHTDRNPSNPDERAGRPSQRRTPGSNGPGWTRAGGPTGAGDD